MDNQKLKTKNAQKYFLVPNKIYGNYQTIEEIKIQTSKCLETRWRCIYLPTGEEKLKRAADIAKFQSPEEVQKHLEDLVKQDKHQQGFRNYLYRSSARNAEERKHKFNLTYDEFISLVKQDCFYCGEKPRPASLDLLKKRGNTKEPTFYYNGIDRIDPSGDYDLENCVPCCPRCNYMKHTSTQQDFYSQIVKIYNHLGLSSTTIENTTNVESEQSTS